MPEIKKFLGIINTTDEEKQKFGALSVADNVNLTASGSIFRRDGFTQFVTASNITSSYGTTDLRYLYIINNGNLMYFDGASFRQIAEGFPDQHAFWCEESPNSLFVASGTVYAHIENANELTHLTSLPIPTGDLDELSLYTESFPPDDVLAMTFHQGSVVMAVSTGTNTSRIQFSVPGQHHLFYKIHKRFEVPDRVVGLESVNGQLLIVCTSNIYAFSTESGLSALADYGAVPGKPIAKLPEGQCFIATTRGIAVYPEFKNITAATYSYPPGKGASAATYDIQGERFILLCTDGAGDPYNTI